MRGENSEINMSMSEKFRTYYDIMKQGKSGYKLATEINDTIRNNTENSRRI